MSDKLDDDEKEIIQDALKDGQEWLDSHGDADAEDVIKKGSFPNTNLTNP